MVNVQEWVDSKYPKEKRGEVSRIYLNEPSLEGELDLSDFTNSDWRGVQVNISLSVDENKLTFKNKSEMAEIIKLIDAQWWLDEWYPKEGEGCLREDEWEGYEDNLGKKRSEIKILYIEGQSLEGSLDLSDFSSLKELLCYDNQLTSLNLSNCLQLERILCNNNNFSSDLSWLTSLMNLKELHLHNNNSYGSLKPLQNLTKLWYLDISDTDLNSGVEYLPESLEQIRYSTEKGPNCKVSEIKEQLDSKYWVDIHKDFIGNYGEILKKEWIEQGFTKEQTKEWIKIGLKLDEYNLVNYLKNERNFIPSQIKNNLSELKKDYENFLVAKKSEKNINQFVKEANLEKIPHQQLSNIEHLADGGFGKIYQAEWEEKNEQLGVSEITKEKMELREQLEIEKVNFTKLTQELVNLQEKLNNSQTKIQQLENEINELEKQEQQQSQIQQPPKS